MYDIVILGSGPGGYVAAIRAAQLGKSVAVVEKSELGGVCLNWGCIPTKAMLKSAEVYNYLKRVEEFGSSIEGDFSSNLEAIVARSREVSSNMSRGIEYLFKKNKITVINGFGSIAKEGEVKVVSESGEESTITAKYIVIATGARPNSLPFAPIDGEKIISYRDALIPKKLPKSLAVIGSGAIGSEFAFFYSSLGVEVHLIEYLGAIVPLEDKDSSSQLSRSFRKMGIKTYVSSEVKRVECGDEGCKLYIEGRRGETTIEVEQVLSAVGVIPNVERIGLEEVGVELERGKIKVDDKYQTSVEGIYAIGDVINTPALAHVASAEGIYCVEKIAGLTPDSIDYNNIPSCIYTSPEVASVGYREAQLKEEGVEYKVGKFPFTASGKATAAGERDGFIKLLIDAKNDKILGAHMVGATVTEMLSSIVVARKLGATASDLIASIHPHPTMSEAIMEAAAASDNRVIHI